MVRNTNHQRKRIALKMRHEIAQSLVALCWEADAIILKSHENIDELINIRTRMAEVVSQIRRISNELWLEDLDLLKTETASVEMVKERVIQQILANLS